MAHLVRRSVEIKAEVVSEDERESGRRAILNAGHTVAHALESASDYRLSHGEAVALGLVAECALAERMGVAEPGLSARVRALLERLGLPVRFPESLDYSTVLRRMSVDKKNRNTQIHCALVSGAGTHAFRRRLDHSDSLETTMETALKTLGPPSEISGIKRLEGALGATSCSTLFTSYQPNHEP